MDAIVLAGGYATRLWPITKDRPKMFLPLDGETVIDRVLAGLEDDDRMDDVYISTNERFAADFEAYLAESAFEKPQLTIEETVAEDEKFGVISALAQLVDRENVTDDTIVIAGDNYISFDVSEFVDFALDVDGPTIGAYDVGSPERATEYGVVELEGDRVVGFEEKPDDPASSLVSIACYAFPADSIGLLDTYLEEGNNPDEPGWFVQWLQNRDTTYAFTFDGAWFDIGTPESYLETVAYTLEDGPSIADSATVENSSVSADTLILDGATVVDSTIEGGVVFPGATVSDATVIDSIIDERATVEGTAIAGSTIGEETTVRGGERVVVGDDEVVGEGTRTVR